MSSKVRQSVADASVHPETITLRSATDWYKGTLGVLIEANVEERNYVNQSWSVMVNSLAEREQVSPVWLSWAISELAHTEIRLARLETGGGGENFST